jgi:hypothetical protein
VEEQSGRLGEGEDRRGRAAGQVSCAPSRGMDGRAVRDDTLAIQGPVESD